jgi:NAD(P)-dependent dehydrogenase (short-subunit alcohol dehydrogenase family)
MRVLIVGAEGTVGGAAASALRHHEIVKAGRSSGDVRVDLADAASITAMFEKLGRVDAVVACAGHVHFGPLATMNGEQFMKGLSNKLMGQVNLVLIGKDHVYDHGSFTLTSSVLDAIRSARAPMPPRSTPRFPVSCSRRRSKCRAASASMS